MQTALHSGKVTPRIITLNRNQGVKLFLFVVIIIKQFLCPISAAGGSLTMESHAITGGGNVSSSSSFRLIGAVGQPEAGVLTSQRFNLVGGLWGDPTGQIFIELPHITTSLTTTNTLLLVWSATWKNWYLQQYLDGEWIAISPPRQQSGGQILAVLPATADNTPLRLSPTPAPAPPQLDIYLSSTNTIVLYWAKTDGLWAVQESSTLPPAWQEVVIAPVQVGNQMQVSIPALQSYSLFRLIKPSALPPPALAITTENSSVIVSWPRTVAPWILKQRTDFLSTSWTSLTNLPQPVSGRFEVKLPTLGTGAHYRLEKQ